MHIHAVSPEPMLFAQVSGKQRETSAKEIDMYLRDERLILRSLRSLFTPDALVGLWLRKETLENMRTAKIQTSLCIHVDWSGSSLQIKGTLWKI